MWLVKRSSFQLAALWPICRKIKITVWRKNSAHFGYKTRLLDLNQIIFAECLGSDPKSILKIFFLRLLLVLTGARLMSELLTNLSLVHVIYANTEWLCPGTILFCCSFTWRSKTSRVYLLRKNVYSFSESTCEWTRIQLAVSVSAHPVHFYNNGKTKIEIKISFLTSQELRCTRGIKSASSVYFWKPSP